MAIDHKYGRVTLEHSTIGADEPVVVFRARDRILPQLLMVYGQICKHGGSPDRHLQMIHDAMDQVTQWQSDHPDQVRLPDSESSKAWLPS